MSGMPTLIGICVVCNKAIYSGTNGVSLYGGVTVFKDPTKTNGPYHSACASTWKESGSRPCKRCGYARDVLVYKSNTYDEWYKSYCTACQLLNSADNHEYYANKHRRKAEGIIARRNEREAKKKAKIKEAPKPGGAEENGSV